MPTPAPRLSSFSGISPQESSSVSQSKLISVPGIGFLRLSTLETVTLSTRFLPRISVTVCSRYSGML